MIDNRGKNFTPNGLNVKAKIVSAGISLGDVARDAGCSNATITHYITGRLRNYRTQTAIWEAYCRLSGQKPSLKEFWGSLLNERISA